jgi:mannose-6-phosphate isomerase-like protein (cupin superfamily)
MTGGESTVMGNPVAVNIAQKLSLFDEAWAPRIVGEVNDLHVKVVKLRGELFWHHHDDEDEMFLVLSGTLRMGLPGGDVLVRPGEFIVVPRGVEHFPSCVDGEVQIVLIEPKTTLHTGNVVNERTKTKLETI